MEPASSQTTQEKRLSAVGVIAEYNPFHKGHAYHLERARELSGADFCVVVMSGDFVQRGAPAIFDKYTRARMALSCGADLVIEIPPAFAVSSAEDFAGCAVALLDRLQAVSHLCFGSECGEIGPLMKTAETLSAETESFCAALKGFLRLGFPFPQARAKALESLEEGASSLLSAPNNLLGVEYCRAILKSNSPLRPLAIRRVGNGYHDACLAPGGPLGQGTPMEGDGGFCSALALRDALKACNGRPLSALEASLKGQIPEPVWELMEHAVPLFLDDFSSLLSYRILELVEQGADLRLFWDVSQELAARIRRQALVFSSLEERIQGLKTRQYTYTRISRSLFHLLLHITKEDVLSRKRRGYVSYFRVLGFRREASPLLSQIKKTASLPLVTKTADAAKILDGEALRDFYGDLFCSHVYQSALGQKSPCRQGNEYARPLVVV